jgi:hypothetical protein
MIATALLYSGRPNPHWRVDPATAARLVPLLAALAPSGSKEALALPGLGYSGIELRLGSSGAGQVWLFHGGLASNAAGTFIDHNREIEDLLAESARDHLPASDYRSLIAGR